eukprot:SAG31_NODE_4091_length_3600_cov_4.531848_4_plen_53_part_00
MIVHSYTNHGIQLYPYLIDLVYYEIQYFGSAGTSQNVPISQDTASFGRSLKV